MATLFDALTAHLPMERTHRQLGIDNPMLKMLLQPELLAGLGIAGAGVGLGMAKMGGKKAAKEALQASERRVAKNILGGEVPKDAAPVFYSRLARALAASDPNQRVRTMRDLEKIGLKGGGASRGEMTLLGERLGALKPVSYDVLDQGKPAASPITWEEEIPLTAAAKRRGSPENTVADILSEMEEAAPLELLDIPHAPEYAEHTVPGGSRYAESSLHVPEDRPYLFGRGDETVPPTTLEALAAYGPTRSGHFPGSLSFALRKNRPMLNEAGEQIGTARSLEQIQSDMMQMGKRARRVLEHHRPDLAKDLQKRWPAIALGRELRRAADEGLDAVTWHPAQRVMKYNPGEPSGMDPFYGSIHDPGQLGNIAKKMAKGIPGAEMKPLATEVAGDSRAIRHLPGYTTRSLSADPTEISYTDMPISLPPGLSAVDRSTGEAVSQVSRDPAAFLDAIYNQLIRRGEDVEGAYKAKSAANAFRTLQEGEPIPFPSIEAATEYLARDKDIRSAFYNARGPQNRKLAIAIGKAASEDASSSAAARNNKIFDALVDHGTRDDVDVVLDALQKKFPREMEARDTLWRILKGTTEFSGRPRDETLSESLGEVMSPDHWMGVFDDMGVTIHDREAGPAPQWGITLNEEAREWLRNNPLRLLGLGGAMAAPFSIMAAQPNRGT